MKRVNSLQIRMKGLGFLTPFYFKASNLRIEWQSETSDRVLIRCWKAKFRISLSNLLLFRIKFRYLVLDELYLEYINRIDSFKKIRFLPKRGRFQIEGLAISQGELYVVDHTLPGPYRLRLKNISIEEGRFDLATSVDLLLQIQAGSADLGRGQIITSSDGKTGNLQLRSVDWNSVIGMEHIPFLPGTAFSLLVHYQAVSNDIIHVDGTLHLIGSDSPQTESGIPFEFFINWDEYRLTMDLGIQKLVEQILSHSKAGILETGLLYVGKGIFDRFKKIAKPN
ncbi:MAG: hypothetical protein H3C43_09740 [Leptonema sp. (in: Bacteria)]|nr:hypothetical protein [Leptonema sp. (in: bacteria)]